jgi:hypothetical protein
MKLMINIGEVESGCFTMKAHRFQVLNFMDKFYKNIMGVNEFPFMTNEFVAVNLKSYIEALEWKRAVDNDLCFGELSALACGIIDGICADIEYSNEDESVVRERCVKSWRKLLALLTEWFNLDYIIDE